MPLTNSVDIDSWMYGDLVEAPAPFCIRTLKFFAAKRKNGGSLFPWCSHFFSFPYFDFTLMNVYRNTGIK